MADFNEDQIKAALIKSNGWNGAGVRNRHLNFGYRFATANRNTILVLFFLIFGLFLSQKSLAEIQPEPVFELKNIGVMQKPIYFIKIYSDGKIHFQGFDVAVNGDHYDHITREQLNEFTLYFFSLPFEVFKKYEIKRGFERWVKAIDYKGPYSSIYINDLIVFKILINKLDKLVNLEQWICFPKNHPRYSSYCFDDVYPEKPDDIKYFLEH